MFRKKKVEFKISTLVLSASILLVASYLLVTVLTEKTVQIIGSEEALRPYSFHAPYVVPLDNGKLVVVGILGGTDRNLHLAFVLELVGCFEEISSVPCEVSNSTSGSPKSTLQFLVASPDDMLLSVECTHYHDVKEIFPGQAKQYSVVIDGVKAGDSERLIDDQVVSRKILIACSSGGSNSGFSVKESVEMGEDSAEFCSDLVETSSMESHKRIVSEFLRRQ